MSLSHTEKVKLVNSLSPAHKEELKRALMLGQGGGGIKTVLMSIRDGLKPIVKAVGMTVLKEVLIPALKAKLAGSGRRKKGGSMPTVPAGRGLKLAGAGRKKKGSGISIPILY